MKILSLGWGVQSFTLAVMSALGDLEKLDFAIHADTTYERSETYEFIKKYTSWLNDYGIKTITVTNKINQLPEKWANGYNQVFIPITTLSEKGEKGKLLRTCTGRWKIAPMRQYLRQIRGDETIEQWMGISLDEYQRMKDSDVKYIINKYPLIEKKMTRNDCVNYLSSHNIDIPPKSSCYFCPYHDSTQWREIQNSQDWEKAIQVDETIRNIRNGYKSYLHPSAYPITELDFRSEEEKGQLSLWDEECYGICGI